MKYRPPPNVNWGTVHPWVAACGGEATRRRAESRQRRGHRSGTEPGSAGEASAAAAPPVWAPSTAACESAPSRVRRAAPQCARRACRWPGAMAFRRALRLPWWTEKSDVPQMFSFIDVQNSELVYVLVRDEQREVTPW